jgi:hypothetical protein
MSGTLLEIPMIFGQFISYRNYHDFILSTFSVHCKIKLCKQTTRALAVFSSEVLANYCSVLLVVRDSNHTTRV